LRKHGTGVSCSANVSAQRSIPRPKPGRITSGASRFRSGLKQPHTTTPFSLQKVVLQPTNPGGANLRARIRCPEFEYPKVRLGNFPLCN
jgi:hypothetical protein